MICPRCGSSIPEGMLVCPDCGHEIQMVPDYNPMDDVLAREIEDQGARRRSAYAARQKAQAAREAELARKRRARQAEKKKRRKQDVSSEEYELIMNYRQLPAKIQSLVKEMCSLRISVDN